MHYRRSALFTREHITGVKFWWPRWIRLVNAPLPMNSTNFWFKCHWQSVSDKLCKTESGQLYMKTNSIHGSSGHINLNRCMISNLSNQDRQTLVKSTFKFRTHFKQLNVSSRSYLYTKYNGDTGRWIDEVACTRPTSGPLKQRKS